METMDSVQRDTKDGVRKQEVQSSSDEAHATNDLPAPQSLANGTNVDHVEDHGEHAAFLPTLQYTSGNDLSSIDAFDPQQQSVESLTSGETENTAQTFDHWPTDTQNQVQEDGGIPAASTVPQDGSARQYATEGGQNPFVQQGQPEQHQQQQGPQMQNQFGSQQSQQHLQQHQQHHPQHSTHQYQHGGTPYDRPTPGASYGTYDGSKPKRKRASPQQLTLLNNIFEMTYFPSSDLRIAIGKELDMVARSVQIWFQNRRSLWRAKAGQILNENKQRKAELMENGMTEQEADAKVTAERTEMAARQIADQRANEAVEFAINGQSGSLAYALHGDTRSPTPPVVIDDGSMTRDDEPGAWAVLQAFHQARTGNMIHQGHPPLPPQHAPSSEQLGNRQTHE